jgi:iron complex transport system substrate-binding protein
LTTSRATQRLKQWRRISLVLLLLFLALAAAGCSGKAVDTSPAEKPTQIITDSIGRQVEVPINPERIACLCPEAGYAIAMYGKAGTIVATSGGMQRDILLVEMFPHLKGLPVPKSNEVINIEELLSSKAELVFVKGDTTSNEAEMDKLKKVNIPVIALQYGNMAEQQYAMQMIAKILGTEAEGQRYTEFYQQTVAEVQKRVTAVPDKDRVTLYHSTAEATRTDTADSLAADWTRAAGITNVSVGQSLKFSDGNHYASLEQILLWNPDYILVNDPNLVGYIMEHEHWRPLQAVKNNRVLPLPIGISRWGHTSSLETPLAVLWTAKLAYPELFKDWDMVKATQDFYQEFFDWQLDQATVDKMLKGTGMRAAKS